MQSSKLEGEEYLEEMHRFRALLEHAWVSTNGNLLCWLFGECAIWTVVLSIYLIDTHSLHAVKG